ncbi:MAG TPA: cytochrome P450 [Chloroflexota bacterium]|nr:cytochrome P450 [Chloroflexota bacterium]
MPNEEDGRVDLAPRAQDWDPLEPEAVADPIVILRWLREQRPLAWTERHGGFWSLFRYQDIVEAADDPETFAQGRPQRAPARPPLEVNPPLHTAYRRILNPYFGRTAVAAMEPYTRKVIGALLEPLLDAGGGDLALSFTYPLPTRVLCAFLHLPDEAWTLIDELSNQIYLNEDGRGGNLELVQRAEGELQAFALRLVSERRRSPLDATTDLVSGLIASEIDGSPPTDEQIIQVLRLLFMAGHNSTTSALGICFLHLARSANIQRRLREQPSLIPSAISEFLRYETPVMGMPRTATRDFERYGRRVAKGEQVFLVWAAANRDPQVFSRPDECVIDRRPNRHLVFGRGIHACIGRGLAEMELRAAVEEVLARTRWISLAGPVRRTSWVRFGVRSLPVRFEL